MSLSRRNIVTSILLAVVVSALSMFACGGEFQPQSKVDSVRLFAVRADKPYARPGETVTLEALTTDARRDKPRPLKIYWIPVVCMNPRDDLYYLCFSGSGDAGAGGVQTKLIPIGPAADAGAAMPGAGGGNALQNIPTNVDVSAFLPQGPTLSFKMPDDAIQPRIGIDPYGLAIVFNVVCAGQIRFGTIDPARGPQQVPILCTDEEGNKLPPDDYVIGISRVYAYEKRTNTNPVIQKITHQGADVDLAAGITVEKCRDVRKRADCPEIKIDVRVSDESWEDNPGEVVRGQQLREQIWASYYTNLGQLQDDARLLFDTRSGRVSESEVIFRAPADPMDGTMWIVVHDNRGGASWVVLPVHSR